MKIFLTGATGFLGSALARHWIKEGHQLILLVRKTSSMHRVADVCSEVRLVECSHDFEIVQLIKDLELDIVVHTACSYGRDGESALQVFDANVRLGMLLIDSILGKKDRRVSFINAGTSLNSSVNNYAMSKQHFTQWGKTLSRQHPLRLQFVNICLQHMFGPNDDSTKFTTHVLRACQQHLPELVLTAGEQCRDFIYIEDVVSAFDVIINNLGNLSTFEQIEVGTGNAPTLREFVELVHALTDSRTILKFGQVPYRNNESMNMKANTARLKQLGWEPAYTLEGGIKKTIQTEFNQ